MGDRPNDEASSDKQGEETIMLGWGNNGEPDLHPTTIRIITVHSLSIQMAILIEAVCHRPQ